MIWNYTAELEDELSLVTGDIVEILEDAEEGWCLGRINGKEGVFPINFVQPILEEESSPYSYSDLVATLSTESKNSGKADAVILSVDSEQCWQFLF